MVKKILSIISILFLLLPGIVKAEDFPEKPNPPRLVNDFEHILSPEELQSLESKLNNYNDSTSNEIAIVTMASFNGYEPGDYANRLFEKWGIGKKDKNNGILILLSKQERKIWIEVGYGLEPVIPDGFAKRVIDQTIIPKIKEGNFYEALDKGTDALIQKAEGEFQGEPKEDEDDGISVGTVFIILLIIWYIISSIRDRKKKRYDNYSGRGRRSGHGGYSSGGGFFGGFFDGGSSDSGGFGGFGGGVSGGGGAGGDW